MRKSGTMIIDPPVTPFSPVEELEAWLAELNDMDTEHPDVQSAIKDAERWLEQRKARNG